MEHPPTSVIAACDEALATGKVVVFETEEGETLYAVPDVIAMNAIANGEEHTKTRTVTRSDGRTVYIYG